MPDARQKTVTPPPRTMGEWIEVRGAFLPDVRRQPCRHHPPLTPPCQGEEEKVRVAGALSPDKGRAERGLRPGSGRPFLPGAKAKGRARAGGFTLIELLLVVAILSAVTLAAFGLAAEDRGETRREDNRNRLALLRRAVLGTETPAYEGGEIRLSGFVADNGRLPASVRELAAPYIPELAPRGAQIPKFAAKRKVSADVMSADVKYCVQDGPDTDNATVLEDAPAALLVKGYRGGGYLGGAARNGEFRDAWGNSAIDDALDAENFGWQVGKAASPNEADSLVFTSYGADNREGGTEYDTDHAQSSQSLRSLLEADQESGIFREDWKVSLAGWQVRVRNATASAIEIPDVDKFSVVLLVFRNDNVNGEWLHFRSEDNNCHASSFEYDDPSDPSIITGGGFAPGDSCTLGFAGTFDCDGDAATPDDKPPSEIPIGRHLALLLDASGAPYKHDGRWVFAQAAFYPGAARPAITLEIR